MKKGWILALAIALLLGAVAFGVVGYITWRITPETTEISDYGMMPFYAFSRNIEDEEEAAKTGGKPMKYIEYRSADGRFVYFREASDQEYFDFEIAKDTEAELRPLQLYVYTYFLDGKEQQIIQTQELNDNQLREIIGNTNKVSAAQYWIFAGILLLAGVYFVYLYARNPISAKKRKQRA